MRITQHAGYACTTAHTTGDNQAFTGTDGQMDVLRVQAGWHASNPASVRNADGQARVRRTCCAAPVAASAAAKPRQEP